MSDLFRWIVQTLGATSCCSDEGVSDEGVSGMY